MMWCGSCVWWRMWRRVIPRGIVCSPQAAPAGPSLLPGLVPMPMGMPMQLSGLGGSGGSAAGSAGPVLVEGVKAAGKPGMHARSDFLRGTAGLHTPGAAAFTPATEHVSNGVNGGEGI